MGNIGAKLSLAGTISWVSNLVLTLLEIIKLLLSLGVIIVIVTSLLWLIGNFKNQYTRFFASENIVSIGESRQLFTSLAHVDVLLLKNNEKWGHTFNQDVLNNSTGFCLHTYAVTFGYDANIIDNSRKSKQLIDPDILTINPVRAESAPQQISRECEEVNLQSRRDHLKVIIKDVLDTQDRVLSEHMLRGRAALATTIDMYDSDCFEEQAPSNCMVSKLNHQLKDKKIELNRFVSEQEKIIADKEKTIRNGLPVAIKEIVNSSKPLVLDEGSNIDECVNTSNVETLWDDELFDIFLESVQDCVKNTDKKLVIENMRDAIETKLNSQARSSSVVFAIKNFLKELNSANVLADTFRLELSSIDAVVSNIKTGHASLAITVSMVAAASQETDYIWGLLNFNDFLIKRDVAKVIYGSYVSPSDFISATHNAWSYDDVLVVELPEPTVLAIDRFTAIVAEKGTVTNVKDDDKKSVLSMMNSQMNKLLENAIQRINDYAVNESKVILRNRLLSQFSDLHYRIRFVNSTEERPTLLGGKYREIYND